MWAIQIISKCKSQEEAEQELSWQVGQDGHLGGRVYQDHDQIWTMQAFQDAEGIEKHNPAIAQWLPDGMRLVFIPQGQRKMLGIKS